MDMRIVGENVNEWRIKRKMTVNGLADASKIDPGNLSRMLRGKSGCSLETLARIATVLQVPMTQLVVEPSNVGEMVEQGTRRIRVLDWSQAGAWGGTLPKARGDEMEQHVIVATTASAESYGLTVEGDAMEPTFRAGDVIVVDPLRPPYPGAFVVAKGEEEKATFKEYRELGLDEAGEMVFELFPLNVRYASRRSDREPLKVLGTVVKLTRDFPKQFQK